MRKLDTSFITGNTGQPITNKSLDHIQNAHIETVDAVVKTLVGGIYNTGDLLVLYGCVFLTLNVPGGGANQMTGGAIYYNGEVYLVDAVPNLTTTAGQTLYFNVDDQSDATADPITMTDQTLRSVHRIRKIKLFAGSTGSGIADYNASTVKRFARQLYSDTTGTYTFRAIYNSRHVAFTLNATPTTSTSGTTIYTLPSTFRISDSFTASLTASCYAAGGGNAQFNKSTPVNINLNTGVITLGMDMPTGTDVIEFAFSYPLV